MGHAGGDARLLGADETAAAAANGAQRRTVEAVRRGAVRARSTQVGPSAWEHVEVTFGDGLELERISSLILEEGGQFHAAIFDRLTDGGGSRQVTSPATPETHGTPAASASGSWRHCRGGVELVFEAEEELELEEVVIVYRRRRDCLVADEPSLPDGLVQEYSPWRAQDSAGAAMLADADDAQPEETEPSTAPAVAGLIEEGDSGDCDSDIEDVLGFASSREAVTAEKDREPEEEDYPDDFEGEDGDASETAESSSPEGGAFGLSSLD
eukprot:TRINITY_DN100850_c0_g1_i1.p1 TRINITY_DN100850_c0_g1~~TRINITY_DN100850_c0_g1_i1.p1  ORF type:complete len:268 (-),score=58.52 TRINITY_DN100850_c0_g1_i1:7-810(-)